MTTRAAAPLEWAVSPGLAPYEAAIAAMEARVAAIQAGEAAELIWLLEHPPLYTAGVGAKPEDLLDADALPVHRTRRGGQFTYHGPGQRVVYVMLDLRRRGRDVHAFVHGLEAWIIESLAALGVQGETHRDRVGVWVKPPASATSSDTLAEEKIAAIGVRLKRWVSFHGIAVNVAPNLNHFAAIRPCGLDASRYGVTSLERLGVAAGGMEALDRALEAAARARFGVLRPAAPPLSAGGP